MKFKDFQAPVLFSSTFKALNLGEKNSSTFKDAWEPCTPLNKLTNRVFIPVFIDTKSTTISQEMPQLQSNIKWHDFKGSRCITVQ